MIKISKRRVCHIIDQAGIEIDYCWKVLSTLKKRPTRKAVPEIVELQGKLTGAIWQLDDLYREIHGERRRLISRKNELDKAWFGARMSRLAAYQKAIRHAITMAKAVGDGFAWIFYINDEKLVEEHLRLPSQLHLPPKIGRTGERAFIEKLQVIEGKLAVYHGITTFLRMGDVSFYDFDQRRIVNVGELKTEKVGESEYRVTLGYVQGGRFSSVVDLSSAASSPGGGISAFHRRKMNRQLSSIAKAIAPAEDRAEQTSSREGTFYFKELESVIEAANTKTMNFKKVGRGLIIAALRVNAAASLSKKLISDRKFYVGKKLDSAIVAAQSIIDPSLNDNSLIMGTLGVGEQGVAGVRNGTIPIFWWPVAGQQLYDLIFGNVIAVTFFNPAHFWNSLRSRGFELSIGER